MFAPSKNPRLLKIAEPKVIGLPLILSSIFIAFVDQTSAFFGAEPGLTLRSILLGEVIIAAFLFLARFTWLRFTRTRPAVMMSTIVMSQIIGQTAASSSLPQLSDAYVSGFNHALFQTGAVLFAAWLIASVKEHQSNLQNLESRQANLLMAKNLGQARLESEREEAIHQVDQILDETLARLNEYSPGLESDVVSLLNRASEDALRPLSHRLAENTEPFTISSVRRPRAQWSKAIGSVVATPLIAPKAMALFMTFLVTRSTIMTPADAQQLSLKPIGGSGIQASVDLGSLASSLFVLFAVFVVTYSTAAFVRYLSQNSLTKANLKEQWFIGIAGLAAISIMTQGIMILIYQVPWLESRTSQFPVTNPIWFIPVTVVAVVLGTVRALDNAQRDVESKLIETNASLNWETVRINDELHASRQHLSQVIHGPIRAAFLASAMEISLALQKKERVDLLLPSLQRRILATKSQLLEPIQTIDLEKEISALRTLWTGVCEITHSIRPETFESVVADPVCATAVHAVIQEATANAIFHAGAKRIEVSMTPAADSVVLEVSNDGSAILEPPKRGLGSALLDEVTTEWSITSAGDRTILHTSIPLRTNISLAQSRL